MSVTREDLERSRWPNLTDEQFQVEHDSRKAFIDCAMSNDAWAVNIKKSVGILLTGSSYSRPYMKHSVSTHKSLGYWLVLSYDNFVNPEWPEVDYNQFLPTKDIMELVDTFLMTHHQNWGGVSYPYMWQLRLASGIFQHFDYVYCANGDCMLEKPEGFPKLLELLGDKDFMSAGPSLPREIGTAGFIVKSRAFMDIAKHMIDHVVPFEEYEKSTGEFGNTEGRLAVAIRDLGLTQAVVPEFGKCDLHPVCEQFHQPSGTWYDLVGFRHIHGEHNYAYRYHKIPPHHDYLDQRFMGDEYNQIKAYWETKDMEILKGWWAKD